MKILVANLGSTSFKYRLFDMADERQLARGGIERIGSPESRCMVEIGGQRQEQTLRVPDHAEAVRQCLAQLTDPQTGCLQDAAEVSAIAFKAVHGGRISGVQRVDARRACRHGGDERRGPGPQSALHRAPCGCWARSCRRFRWWRPSRPTSTHRFPTATATTPSPTSGPKTALVRRYGFHGASHRYIATRTAELLGPQRSADHLLPPGRLQFAVRDPQRPERGHAAWA